MPDLEKIRNYFRKLITGPVTVAFSGGADSVLVLKLTLEASQNAFPVYPVYVDSGWMSRSALQEAQENARQLQTNLHVIRLDCPESIGIENNPQNRCYLCKKAVFKALTTFADSHSCSIILEGTQIDDLKKYRPGLKALKESGAISPLKELGLDKAEVRHWLSYFGLAAAKKPSGSCLATRLPYGKSLSAETLLRIDEAETWLKRFDLGTVRVRSHDDIARIEVDVERLEKIIPIRGDLIRKLQSLGWKYVTLDLEGFRSGSMD